MAMQATNLQFDYSKYGFRDAEKYVFKSGKGLNKQAVAYEEASMEWVDGNIGSKLTMKYPSVYLMSRGLKESDAMSMIVLGFMEPFTRELPMEYAVELNRLIQLEMEGSVG